MYLIPVFLSDSTGVAIAKGLTDTLTASEVVGRTLVPGADPPESFPKALTDALTATELLTPRLILLPITETWTVPNVLNTLAGDHPWEHHIGSNQWQVFGNRARLTGAGSPSNQGGRLMIPVPPDITATVMIAQWAVTGSTAWLGVLARLPGPVLTFYEALLLKSGATYTLSLYRFTDGASVQLVAAVPTTPPVAGTTTLGLRTFGADITALRDGAPVLTVTDPAGEGGLATGNFVGLLGGVGTGDQIEVDTFTASVSLVVPTPGPVATVRPVATAQPVISS